MILFSPKQRYNLSIKIVCLFDELVHLRNKKFNRAKAVSRSETFIFRISPKILSKIFRDLAKVILRADLNSAAEDLMSSFRAKRFLRISEFSHSAPSSEPKK